MGKKLRILKKKAWSRCSIYVRKRYANAYGYVKCYTCGIVKYWKDIQAGHGFSGRGNAILFEEDIIRPQCYGCNVCNAGKLHIFTYKLRKELGNKRFEELYKQQFGYKSFTQDELQEIIDKYTKMGGLIDLP